MKAARNDCGPRSGEPFIRRLDVLVNDPLAMQAIEEPGDRAADVKHGLELQLTRLHHLMQRSARQPLHDQDEPRTVVLQRVGAGDSFKPLLGELLEEEVLTRVSDPIVIFVDEIDMALGCEFSLDDFFALIRSLYNKFLSNS